MSVDPAFKLRAATIDDAAVAMSWTPEDEALRRWAGPSTRCPATVQTFWEDINNADATTFAWVNGAAGLVGFGQVRHREQTYGHLARVIVSPRWRGQGLGRQLCLALMREAVHLHPNITAFTLYVFPDNLTAIALYRSLGYVDAGRHEKFDCVLMQAPLTALPR